MSKRKWLATAILLGGCVAPPVTTVPPEANIPAEGNTPARIDYDYVTTPAGADPLPPPNLEDYTVEFQGSYYGDAKIVFGEDLLSYRDYIERYAEELDEEYGLQLSGVSDKRCRTRTFPPIKLATIPTIPKPPNLDKAGSDVDEDILIYTYIEQLRKWILEVKSTETSNRAIVRRAVMDFNNACQKDKGDRKDKPKPKSSTPPSSPRPPSTPPPKSKG